MVIRVMYDDGSYDMIKASRLDDLLPSGRVAKFLRSDGWAIVGVDPIRKSQDSRYSGPERREATIMAEAGG